MPNIDHPSEIINIIHNLSFQQEEDEPSRRLCLAATIPAAQPSDKK